jgi:precorrin-6B methylase 1
MVKSPISAIKTTAPMATLAGATRAPGDMRAGSLTVVGTGICTSLDITLESKACIERASQVLYLVADTPTAAWIEQLNPRAESLAGFYQLGRPRYEIYAAVVEEILNRVRSGADLCVAFYGHPGFYAVAGHEAIRLACLEGFKARMLPGISCEDRMFADLGVDPGASGCQTYEATAFLIYRFRFDTSAALVLLQIGVLGEAVWPPVTDIGRIDILSRYLQRHYGQSHEVIVYEASSTADGAAELQQVALANLAQARISVSSTLFVAPRGPPSLDTDMAHQLGLRATPASDEPGAWARGTPAGRT